MCDICNNDRTQERESLVGWKLCGILKRWKVDRLGLIEEPIAKNTRGEHHCTSRDRFQE